MRWRNDEKGGCWKEGAKRTHLSSNESRTTDFGTCWVSDASVEGTSHSMPSMSPKGWKLENCGDGAELSSGWGRPFWGFVKSDREKGFWLSSPEDKRSMEDGDVGCWCWCWCWLAKKGAEKMKEGREPSAAGKTGCVAGSCLVESDVDIGGDSKHERAKDAQRR
jgi:hypothetical protein